MVYSQQLAVYWYSFNLTLDCLQDDENALLQQALAMSMDDLAASLTMRDADMSEAAADDQDLALGKC